MVAKLSKFPHEFCDHAYPFWKTTPGTYLDVAIAKNSLNLQGNCDSFATIYGREMERKQQSWKYFVSVTRGAPIFMLLGKYSLLKMAKFEQMIWIRL